MCVCVCVLKTELEGLDPIGPGGVTVNEETDGVESYDTMWRVTFDGATVEGDVEALQVLLQTIGLMTSHH